MKHGRYTEKHVGVGMFEARCFAIPTVKVPAYFNDSQRQATKDAGTRFERRQSVQGVNFGTSHVLDSISLGFRSRL